MARDLSTNKFAAQNRKARHDFHIEDTLDAGMVGGQIAARSRQRLQINAAWKLNRVVLRPIGRLRKDRKRRERRGQREGSNSPASATNGKHHGSLWLLEEFTNAIRRGASRRDNAVFDA